MKSCVISLMRRKMSKLYVARRPKRRGLYIPMGMSRLNPSLLFPLDGLDPSELDELIRAQLAKVGVTKESDVQAVIDKAEEDSEARIKLAEVRRELRRLMKMKEDGAKLMQVGFRKWKSAFYRK